MHRRDHARRVPQAHREGRRARAPLPAGAGRRADASRTRSPSCAACASATRSTTACASRTRRWSPPPCCRNRYIADRFLPDKAIDLVDEAASKLRMEIDSMPAELDEVDAPHHAARDRARGAAQGDRRGVARSGWRKLEKELADLKEQRDAPDGAAGSRRRTRSSASRKLKEELEQAASARSSRRSARATTRKAVRAAVRPAARARAAARRATRRGWPSCSRARGMLKEEVDEEDIAEVVSRWTGIPVSRADGGRDPEAAAHGGAAAPARVGQDEAVDAVAERRSGARAPACRTRTGRSAASSSSARPASARPSWRARWPSSCSTTSRR